MLQWTCSIICAVTLFSFFVEFVSDGSRKSSEKTHWSCERKLWWMHTREDIKINKIQVGCCTHPVLSTGVFTVIGSTGATVSFTSCLCFPSGHVCFKHLFHRRIFLASLRLGKYPFYSFVLHADVFPYSRLASAHVFAFGFYVSAYCMRVWSVVWGLFFWNPLRRKSLTF